MGEKVFLNKSIRETRAFNLMGGQKMATKLTSSSFPFVGIDALAFTWYKIRASESLASCIEARINSAERMLQK